MKFQLFSLLLAGALPAPAPAEMLKVDKERSRIQVDAKATGHAFTGTLGDYQATVKGDAATLQPTAVKLTWKFADLKTGDGGRDAEMIKWLGGGAPEGSFEFTKTWEDKGQHYAQGKLTIKGVSKSIGFPYTAAKDGGWVTIDATVGMNYEDFGLPLIRKLVMTVQPGLSVRIHLVGKVE
jgi:polyisoprenoid-binding protein YceI